MIVLMKIEILNGFRLPNEGVIGENSFHGQTIFIAWLDYKKIFWRPI